MRLLLATMRPTGTHSDSSCSPVCVGRQLPYVPASRCQSLYSRRCRDEKISSSLSPHAEVSRSTLLLTMQELLSIVRFSWQQKLNY